MSDYFPKNLHWFFSLFFLILITIFLFPSAVRAGGGPSLTWDLKWGQPLEILKPLGGGGELETRWSVWGADSIIENRARSTSGWERSFVTIGEDTTDLAYSESYNRFELATGGSTLKPFVSSDWDPDDKYGCTLGPSFNVEVSGINATVILTNTTGVNLYIATKGSSQIEGPYRTLIDEGGEGWLVIDPDTYIKFNSPKENIRVQTYANAEKLYRCATIKWDVDNYTL